MAFTPAVPRQDWTHIKMQFNGTFEHVAEIVGAINTALGDGRLVRGEPRGFKEGETVMWNIDLTTPDDVTVTVHPTDYIVVATNGAGTVMKFIEADYLQRWEA